MDPKETSTNVETGITSPFPPGEKPEVETTGSDESAQIGGLIGDVHTVADDLSEVVPNPGDE